MTKSTYSEQDRQFIKDNIHLLTANEMAIKLSKSIHSVWTFLRMNGFKTSQYPNLYAVPAEQFIHCTTPEVAYILGYLWADGYVEPNGKVVVLNCTKDDMDDIEPVFDKTGRWNKTAAHRKGQKPTRTFRTHNPALFDHLAKHGYLDKSQESPDTILDTLSDNLKPYWWLGFLDGDGCIYVSSKGHGNLVISGSYDQDWTALKKLANKFGISLNIGQRRRGKHCWSHISIHIQEHVKKLLEWIYGGRGDIGLRRKREKARLLLNHIRNRHISKSGYIGVDKEKVAGMTYYARIAIGSRKTKQSIHLGTFNTAEEAAVAYDKAAVKQRGTRARTNFPITNYLPLASK